MYRRELSKYEGHKVRMSCQLSQISIHEGRLYACMVHCKLIDYNLSFDHIWIHLNKNLLWLKKKPIHTEFIVKGIVKRYKHIEQIKMDLLGVNSKTYAYKLKPILEIKENI